MQLKELLFQKRVDFATGRNFCQTLGMSLLSPPSGTTDGVVSTSVYERILLRLQTEARSNRRRTMVWLELVRIRERKCGCRSYS